ncbi:MAG TPA: maleylacetoacetate isomerase [Burkholderiaceae bacterium]|nr:maleylacetoacetate isomerase [Burkholderiaceae bacterium]
MFKLYNAARSSASFRMRVALNLKGLPFEYVAIDLRKGVQSREDYRRLNPQELVPLLDDGTAHLTQSLATIEYLEERYPQPPLLPHAPLDRAYVRGVALAVACEIHPLNNLRVLRYLVRDMQVSDEKKNIWYRHWVEQGLAQIEGGLVAGGRTGRYTFADQVTVADICIVPQIFNAQRFDCRLDHVPTVMRIFENCMQLAAFENARPEKQPDFVE